MKKISTHEQIISLKEGDLMFKFSDSTNAEESFDENNSDNIEKQYVRNNNTNLHEVKLSKDKNDTPRSTGNYLYEFTPIPYSYNEILNGNFWISE